LREKGIFLSLFLEKRLILFLDSVLVLGSIFVRKKNFSLTFLGKEFILFIDSVLILLSIFEGKRSFHFMILFG